MAHDLVMDRFRLGERLGVGGMGVVYRAFDERLRREVAVKEIVAADPERVLREAQAAARLNHPAIATVYELGRRGTRALLVSELVPGPTLDRARASGSVTDRAVAEIGVDLCAAIAHAHARGVVHRDVKPQNVIVTSIGAPPRAKLMDFGIARVASAPTLTAAGEVVGTLAYMAPEQAEGLPAGPPADVYSLALTLYECWAGSNPVAARTPAETARRIGERVTSLADLRPDLPLALVDAIDACLAGEPDLRPSPEALGERLAAGIGSLDSDRPVPAPVEPEGSEPRRAGLRPARLALPAGFAAALLAIAGPGDAPGAALVLGALGFPALLTLPGLGPAAPLLAPVLGALGALGAYPGAAAQAGRRAGQRALAGALGWWSALAVAIGAGLGPRLGLAPAAPDGWESSASEAAASVLVPLLEPAAAAGAVTFAVASATLGWIIATRHLALAALGALVWAGGFVAVLRLIADGSLGERPALAAAAAAVALVAEHARRTRDRRSDPAPGAAPIALDRPGAAPGGTPAVERFHSTAA